MKKIKNELKLQINHMDGNILLIGNYDEEIQQLLLKKDIILSCDQLLKKESYKNNFSYKGEKTKKLNIKNLRKKYKKKGLNYMIVNAEDIIPYKNRFVRDSIYITKKSIYLIGNEDVLLVMYKRYSKQIEKIECLDGVIIKIDVSKSKNNKIKDFLYFVKDNLIDLGNAISDFLIS